MDAARAWNNTAVTEQIGRYVVVREIARGGMGVVYEAEDPQLKRRVAIKTLPEGDVREDDLARFRREATIAAGLQHSNIVAIHEVGTEKGVHFIVMDLVEGCTFAEVIADQTRQRADRLRMIEDVARAVAFAHGRGVIHRDLKPANILVDPRGRVMLTDFGLARSTAAMTQLTQSNTVMGTPRYMSPEQVDGRTADVSPRTDVYALGVILYETLAGRPPFDHEVPAKLFNQILMVDADPPSRAAPWVERDLDVVCLKAMDKDPSRRYATAAEFADDIARVRRGEHVQAQPPSLVRRLSKRLAKRKAAVALVATIAVAALLTGALWFGLRHQRTLALDELRNRTRNALDAALDLRRAGSLAGCEKYLKQAEEACATAMREFPALAEPHYRLGRMRRAVMRDEEALREQEAALKLDPAWAPALYERVVLTSRKYRRRIDEIAEARWGDEGQALIRQERSKRAGMTPAQIAAKDDVALRLRAALEADLRALTGGVGEGELACAKGLLAWARSDFAAARSLLESAVEKEPTLEEAYEALAGLELDQSAYEASAAWCTKGFELDKGYLPHLHNRCFARLVWGVDLQRLGSDPSEPFRKAIADATQVVMADPTRATRGSCAALRCSRSTRGGPDTATRANRSSRRPSTTSTSCGAMIRRTRAHGPGAASAASAPRSSRTRAAAT